MTLILLEGFDSLSSSNELVEDEFARLHHPSNVTDAFYTVDGRDGGKAVRLGVGLATSWYWLQPPGNETNDTWIIGFNWKSRGTGGHVSPFFRLGQSNVAGFGDGLQLQVLTNNVIEINDGDGNQLAVTASDVFTEDTWLQMELKAKCHAADGTVELRIDGVNVASATSVNTATIGDAEWASVIFSGTGTTTRNPIFDDLYICNDQGSTNNDFLGACFVRTLRPTSDAGPNDGTPSAAVDHYTLVDEVKLDEDATYITLDTDTDKEMFGYEALASGGLIFGVAMTTLVTTVTACDVRVNQVFESNASESSQNSKTLPASSYYGIHHVQEVSPDTSVAWTTSEINAGTFGCELDVQ
jgi:hypothetical protein